MSREEEEDVPDQRQIAKFQNFAYLIIEYK